MIIDMYRLAMGAVVMRSCSKKFPPTSFVFWPLETWWQCKLPLILKYFAPICDKKYARLHNLCVPLLLCRALLIWVNLHSINHEENAFSKCAFHLCMIAQNWLGHTASLNLNACKCFLLSRKHLIMQWISDQTIYLLWKQTKNLENELKVPTLNSQMHLFLILCTS